MAHRRPTRCPPDLRLSNQRVLILPASPNKKATAGVAFLFGGGGGNRTRVRKPSTVRTTCLAWSFESRLAPANRQADAQPVASTDPHSQATRPCREADVNDTAPLAGPDPSAGQCSVSPVLGGERITLVVGVYRISSGLTRLLDLGMPCAASQPASKPGRPHEPVNAACFGNFNGRQGESYQIARLAPSDRKSSSSIGLSM